MDETGSNKISIRGEAAIPLREGAAVVLVVEDDRVARLLLKKALEAQGHRVLEADRGEQGLELFAAEDIDIVLMDLLLPGMSGLDATREIKRSSGETLVPVMFLTGTHDETDLAACLDAGGDDFLVKPWHPVVLEAKIHALLRMRDLHREATAQRDLLEQHQARLIREQEVAERLYSSMLRGAGKLPDVMKCMMSPASIFSGDVVFHAVTPSGAVRALVGDFTGHGLQSAIGAMPVNDIFCSMTDKGFSVVEVVKELNRKLEAVLPTRMFFACILLELVPEYDRLLVWNGGMPDVLLTDSDGNVTRRIRSRHLALGIQHTERIDPKPENVPIEIGQRVYLYSDGIIEASNPSDQMFGQKRLEAFLSEHARSEDLFGELGRRLLSFTGRSDQDDDFALVEIRHLGSRERESGESAPRRSREPMHWRASLEFDADMLRSVDPLPLLMQLTVDLQGLHSHREKIYLVLAELYYNALDHGLLHLDSSLKESPEGFSEYYRNRAKRIEELESGTIRVFLGHERDGGGGRLRIAVEDSGQGFDVEAKTRSLAGNLSKSGRGLALVRSLTRELRYSKGGTRVDASYVWTNDLSGQSETARVRRLEADA